MANLIQAMESQAVLMSNLLKDNQEFDDISPTEPNSSLPQRPDLPLEKIIMGNIQDLYPKTNQNKMPFLKELSIEEEPMIIALTEIHLTSGVKDTEVNIKNYTPFRTDPESRSHGGVMLYIRNDLSLD